MAGKEEKIEKNIVEIKDYFKEKEISNFFNNLISLNIKRIISDLNNYIESGDWKSCLILIRKLLYVRIFKYANEEYKKIFLDILIKKLLPNMYIYLQEDIEIIFELIYYTLKYVNNYSIDWKFFYTMFIATDSYKDLRDYKTKLFISLHKYYNEDAITYDEYKILVRHFYEGLVNEREVDSYCIFIYFFPRKYILEDDELQLRILYLMINSQINFTDCCCMFHKILRKNGKLFFSKDAKKNKEYIDTFIKYFFTFLDSFIVNCDDLIRDDYISPIPLFNKKDEKRINFEKSIASVLIELLFNPNFKDVYPLVEQHLQIILNDKQIYLKEKSKDNITINYIDFLQGILYGINRLFHDKQYDKNAEKFILIPKKFEGNEHLFNRLLTVLKCLSSNLRKCFLYDNKGTFSSQRKLFILFSSFKFDNNDYIKQILQIINFEEYLKILDFFKEHSETRMIKYVIKLYSIMPLLLNEYVYSNYPKVRKLVKDSAQFLADNVSSANVSAIIDILIIFSFEFFKIKELNKKNKIYGSLIPIIIESSEKIMKNIMIILSLVIKRDLHYFRIFIYALKKFLGKEGFVKISSLYANYIENNEIESSDLFFYFFIMNKEEHIALFNHMYNSLIYIDDSNNIEINKNFIYQKYDKDLNIDISKISIEISSEKQLQRYQKIFSQLNYSIILTNDKLVKKFYEVFFSLMNQKDKKFQKFGMQLFGYAINSILECKDNEENNLVEYPSEYHMNTAIQMYEKIIVPYEKYIADYIKNNPKSRKDNENEELGKQNQINNVEKFALEKIFENYIGFIHEINRVKCNIILNLNFEQENFELLKLIQNQFNLYKKYKMLFKNSLELITQIYEYNGGTTGNYLFSKHNTNLYLDEILGIIIEERTSRNELNKKLHKQINNIILNNNFNYFMDLYAYNKARISKYDYFEMIKIIMPKEESFYIFLKLYLLSFNSVTHSDKIICSSIDDYYSNNPEKIKNIYNEIYNTFIISLEKLNQDSLVEQNIMDNIFSTFYEFSKLYISLYPYDSIDIIEKLLKMIMLLKQKKYKKIESFILAFIDNMDDNFIQVIRNYEKDKRFIFNQKKNEIIESEMNKLITLKNENQNKNNFIKKYQKNIEAFIEIILNMLLQTRNDKSQNDIEDVYISHAETFLFYKLLSKYAMFSIDKKSELYKKVMRFILNMILTGKSPISKRILWIKRFCLMINLEYQSYLEYEWILIKSDEEYKKLWDKMKYEYEGTLYIPHPCSRVIKRKFIFNDCINENSEYNINLEDLLISMAEIDEYEEYQKHIRKYAEGKISTLDEVVSKSVNDKFKQKDGLDFDKAKMFYHLFKLKYIDINSEYISKINYSIELSNKSGKKINNICVIYEFLLGKYQYMLENKLFGEKERNEFWKIMEKYTRSDKIMNKKIYAYYHYLFKNCCLGDLEYIFDYDFYKYPIKFVTNLYYLFNKELCNLIPETKIFKKDKTEELIERIFSKEENIILVKNSFINIIKIFFSSNHMINYNYYFFKDEYSKEFCEYYMKILSKCDTKYRRYKLLDIYLFYFRIVNCDLSLMKSSLQKIALCAREFANADESNNIINGEEIAKEIIVELRSEILLIDFPALCDMISDILKSEKDWNSTYKSIYLQTINHIYRKQKHFNLVKYSKQEIFNSLFKVFISISNEESRKKFSAIFLAYFNELSEEENKKFIEKYQKYIFEDVKAENDDENKYNYILILMKQLLRFKDEIPDYMQEFIIKLKIVNKKDDNKLKNIIIDSLKIAMEYYHGSYIFMKENISEECKNVLEEMTKEKSYFI